MNMFFLQMRSVLVAAVTTPFICSPIANAKVHGQIITYKQGDTQLEGYLAYDDEGGKTLKPGVLVIHDWMGVSDDTKMRADQLAQLGYVAFAADIYGKSVRPKNTAEAGKAATTYKADRQLMRQRAKAGLSELIKQKGVDSQRVAAIGYCFGGTTALELARSGANIKGVVSFHGGLETPRTEDAKNIRAKVLVLHGADDPYVSESEVKNFENEMRTAKVDWELVKYSNAVHAFTIKGAGSDNSKGAAYNAEADKRSWIAMKNFFAEIF